MPLLPNLPQLFGVLLGEFLVVQLGLPSVVSINLAGLDAAVAEGATDHAGMLALGDGLAVRPRIARRRCRQVAAGTLVILVMIKEPILYLSLASEWALDDAKRT